ncbi:MAG: hypothetical protein D6698_13320 [Gammaproteobacteria bacterium]|nr:MAG: hypothetical protein D6698_13320 [Gammaproteobacteria bacterium]
MWRHYAIGMVAALFLLAMMPAQSGRAPLYNKEAYVGNLPKIAPPLTGIMNDGVHDPEGGAVRILQNPAEAMSNFPKDYRGEVDWARAINEGYINPRKTKTGRPEDGPPMPVLDMDIIMKQTAQMPWVRFPHSTHTKWLACSNCHPDIFVKKTNGNPVTMTKILKGEFCGRCHDKVSFSLWNCYRCHSVPHDGIEPH